MANSTTPAKTAKEQLAELAQAEFPALKPAEIKLIAAATTTLPAACGPSADPRDPSNDPEISETGDAAAGLTPWDADREVRADVIRWLCVNRAAKELVDPRGIQIFGARVTGEVDLRHCTVAFPLSLIRCRLMDAVYFTGCTIPRIDLESSSFGAVNADGAHVQQSIYLRGVHASARVSLNLAQIGGTLTCEEGRFAEPGGMAIWADGIKVDGDVLLRADSSISGVRAPFHADGGVRLVGAEIHGDLDCSGGEFFNEGGDAILLERATIRGEIFLGDQLKVKGVVTLSNSSAIAISDEHSSWPTPGNLKLDGLTYANLEPREAKSRLRWLAVDSSDGTQPYRQLAKVLQDAGDSADARSVLIAMEKKLSGKGPVSWMKALIGYGYRPGNAVWGMMALWAAASLVCWQTYESKMIVPTDKDAYAEFQKTHTTPAYYPPFQPAVFSLENTFPLVKLGQADKWQPDARAAGVRWFLWVQVLLGWLFATLFVAGVSGIVQHD
jgi:hypothetical protein